MEPESGQKKAVGEFEKDAFADAGRTEQDAGLVGSNRKTYVFKHRVIESN